MNEEDLGEFTVSHEEPLEQAIIVRIDGVLFDMPDEDRVAPKLNDVVYRLVMKHVKFGYKLFLICGIDSLREYEQLFFSHYLPMDKLLAEVRPIFTAYKSLADGYDIEFAIEKKYHFAKSWNNMGINCVVVRESSGDK